MEQRRRNLRIILGTIIIITLPFYCAGLVLWGTAPQRVTTTPPGTQAQGVATDTPGVLTATVQGEASVTPLGITVVPTFEPFPTFSIPTPIPTVIIPTRFLSPTPTFFQPTNPPPPTSPPQPTQPPITNTPLPFDTLPPP
jgi:hypothetical protein